MKRVSFYQVDIIEFPTILGVGACSGPALTLGWNITGRTRLLLNRYEAQQPPVRRRSRDLVLSSRTRMEILKQNGFTSCGSFNQIERMGSIEQPNATHVYAHHSCMGELKEVLKERPAMMHTSTNAAPCSSKPLQMPLRRGSILTTSAADATVIKRKDSIKVDSTMPLQPPTRRGSIIEACPFINDTEKESDLALQAVLYATVPPKRTSLFDGSQPLQCPVRRGSIECGNVQRTSRGRLLWARSA